MLRQVAREEIAALLEAQHDVRHAMQSVQSSRRLDEQQQEQQEQHLAEAEARVKKLRLLVQGPSIPQVQSMHHPRRLSASHSIASHYTLCKGQARLLSQPQQKRGEKGMLMLFSHCKGSLLGQQPRATTIGHDPGILPSSAN